MTERPLPLSAENGPVERLYGHDCSAIVALTMQQAGKTVNGAPFTFLRIADIWYRLSFRDRALFCIVGGPSDARYASTGDGFSYKPTDLSALVFSGTTRVTDIYLTEGQNTTRAVFCLSNARRLELCNYWDSSRTALSII